MHETAADVMAFMMRHIECREFKNHLINIQNFETALNLNAKERSRRFASNAY
jgi:hypothetical protein